MSPELLSRIWQRLDSEPPLFFADEVGRHFGDDLTHFIELGLLSETTPSSCVPCWDCGRGFVGRVEFLLHRRTGTRRPYIHCPECGVKEVSPNSLKRWTVDAAGCLAAISAAAGIRGPTSEVVAGCLWRMGRAVWGQRPREVYFARHVHEGNRPGVVEGLATHPKAILLVPTHASAERWDGTTPNLILALEGIVGIEGGKPTFDTCFIESRLAELEVPTARRPTRRRADRAAKIEALVAALVDHLRAARDHAFVTRDQTGSPELLPRPSQQDLARLAAMSKSDVSRCLADESARELRLYWDIALDLNQIMDWRSRPRTKKR
jgi:DNA-directed RNA polymerase subunit RPC12/RpoP